MKKLLDVFGVEIQKAEDIMNSGIKYTVYTTSPKTSSVIAYYIKMEVAKGYNVNKEQLICIVLKEIALCEERGKHARDVKFPTDTDLTASYWTSSTK